MPNEIVQARIDRAVKKEAAAVLAAMGLTVSDAVRLLLTGRTREGAALRSAGPQCCHHGSNEGSPRRQPSAVRDRRGPRRRSACGRLSGPAGLSAIVSDP